MAKKAGQKEKARETSVGHNDKLRMKSVKAVIGNSCRKVQNMARMLVQNHLSKNFHVRLSIRT